MKRLMRFRGLMVIVLWQTVPIGIDEQGRTRIGFGFGAGQLEFAHTACDGTVTSEAVGYRTAAAEAEHWVSEKVRVHAAVGHQWSDSVSARGPFGGILLSVETQHFGFGAGPAVIPAQGEFYEPEFIRSGPNRQMVPSGYMRVGNTDGVHVRAEVFPPSAHTSAEAGRLVIGLNQFDSRRASGYIGLGAIVAWESEGSMGLVGGYFQPISPNLELGMRGFASPGKQNAQLGLTTQVRYTLR